MLVCNVSCSEFDDGSDDDGRGGDNDEERERLKRRKFIMDEFKRRNQVSIAVCLKQLKCSILSIGLTLFMNSAVFIEGDQFLKEVNAVNFYTVFSHMKVPFLSIKASHILNIMRYIKYTYQVAKVHEGGLTTTDNNYLLYIIHYIGSYATGTNM